MGQDNVEPLVVLQPISVDTASPDQTGMLVIVNGLLVAILARLDAPWHERPGAWHMEAGLGPLMACVRPCSTPSKTQSAGCGGVMQGQAR